MIHCTPVLRNIKLSLSRLFLTSAESANIKEGNNTAHTSVVVTKFVVDTLQAEFTGNSCSNECLTLGNGNNYLLC